MLRCIAIHNLNTFVNLFRKVGLQKIFSTSMFGKLSPQSSHFSKFANFLATTLKLGQLD